MNGYSTNTTTGTYTVLDIRKTFEGFEADLRMIARRTEKWPMEHVDNVFYDIIQLAEAKYINYIDITLIDLYNNPIRASRFTVQEDGKAITSDRAGGNDWCNITNSSLVVIINYNAAWRALSEEAKQKFYGDKKFKINWVTSHIDDSYSHLTKENAQTFASKGYELNKTNFK